MNTVYTFDEQGYFSGMSERMMDPVRGTYADINDQVATLVEPPQFNPETHKCRWIDDAWVLEKIPEKEVPKESYIDAKNRIMASLSLLRSQKEAVDLELPSGLIVSASPTSLSRITATVSAMDRYGYTEVDFEARDKWVTLDVEKLREIEYRIFSYNQQCFSAARRHAEAIDRLETVDELNAYDLTANWPVV